MVRLFVDVENIQYFGDLLEALPTLNRLVSEGLTVVVDNKEPEPEPVTHEVDKRFYTVSFYRNAIVRQDVELEVLVTDEIPTDEDILEQANWDLTSKWEIEDVLLWDGTPRGYEDDVELTFSEKVTVDADGHEVY